MSMRTVLQIKGDQIQAVREMLSKNPPGNATQRKQLLRSGWKPNWRQMAKSAPSSLQELGFCPSPTEESTSIALENNLLTTAYREDAERIVAEIENQISRFSIPEPVSTPCPICGKVVIESGGPMVELVNHTLSQEEVA